MSFFQKRKELISLIVLAVVFFYLYLFLYLNPSVLSLPSIQSELPPPLNPPLGQGGTEPAHLILNQPDESVNYFFIRQLVLNNRFSYPELLSELTDNQVHPRSTTVVHGAIVPIGFPGMIVIYGFLLKIATLIAGVGFFNLLAVSITPLLAVLTPFFFYGFLRRIFSQSIAWLSAVLLFFLPAWWYYASRPFQHNTLFVFLIVLGLYSFVKFVIPSVARSAESRDLLNFRLTRDSSAPPALFPKERESVGMTFVIGLLFGLAIYVRPSEIIWMLSLGLILLIVARRAWSGREFLGLVAGIALTAVLFFSTQTAFYGHPLGSGYVVPQSDGSAGLITTGPQNIPLLKSLALPFGFHPRAIWHNFKAYFFDLFGIWTILAVFGALFLMKDIRKYLKIFINIYKYFLIFLGAAIFLLIFYGSWSFFDNLLKVPSIGTSYVRYFLPIYVFSLPLVAWLIVWLWRRSRILKVAAVFLVMILFLSSTREVFAPLEGLASVKTTIKQYQEYQSKIYQLTESESVIVTRYADKYLFPGRKIIAGFENEEQIKAIGNLVNAGLPVYLYDLKLDEKNEMNLRLRLQSVGAELSAPVAGWEDLEMRKIIQHR